MIVILCLGDLAYPFLGKGRVPIVIPFFFFWNNSSRGSLASQQYTAFFHSFMSDINFHEVARPSWPLGFCIVLAWLDFKYSTSKIVRNSGNISGYVFQVCFLVWTISPLRVGITLHRWNCQNLGILFLCYWYGWPTQRKSWFQCFRPSIFQEVFNAKETLIRMEKGQYESF